MPYHYSNNDFNFIPLHIRCRTVTNHRKDLCAVFQLPGVQDGLELPSIWRMLSFEAKVSLRDCS